MGPESQCAGRGGGQLPLSLRLQHLRPGPGEAEHPPLIGFFLGRQANAAVAIARPGACKRHPEEERVRRLPGTLTHKVAVSGQVCLAVWAGADRLAVDMPGRVAKDRQNHDQADEQRRQRDQQQQAMVVAQKNMAFGFFATVFTLVTMAVTKSTSRSNSIGNETAE